MVPTAHKKKESKKAPGGGDGRGDDDPDKDSNDSDEKFVRRMKKFLGVVSTKAEMMRNPRSRKRIPLSFQPSQVQRHIGTGASKPERQ